MAAKKIKPPLSVVIGLLLGSILISLQMMSSATQDSSRLGEMYSLLLLFNTLGSILLLGLVGTNIYTLVRQFRHREAGSRLTARMVFLFVLLALAPAGLVFYYSMQFLHQSIDSWFDVEVDQAMEDALELSRAALDQRMRGFLADTSEAAEALQQEDSSMLAIRLGEQREKLGATELTLLSRQGRIMGSSSTVPGIILPNMPTDAILHQLRQRRDYVGLDPAADDMMQIRAVVSVDAPQAGYLQALIPVPHRLSSLAGTVESAYVQYKEMTYLRNHLKLSFSLTLSLVLSLSLLAATWVAFLSVRRIVAPVRELVQGTQAVAAGNYEQQLPVINRDELGFLVKSFNQMTRGIARARDEAERSQREVENQRAYLETVISNLTSGMIGLDANLEIATANQAADHILGISVADFYGQPLMALAHGKEDLMELAEMLEDKLRHSRKVWQAEIAFVGPNGRQQLLCRGTPLLGADGNQHGAVMLFDDVTDLIRAQRDAAWAEVARRLAHEIKNPLTPIQLSAERMRHKLMSKLDEGDAGMLDRGTRTIVQQVEAMKTMVNAFSEYARPPKHQPQLMDINSLIEEVIALYPPQPEIDYRVTLAPDLPNVELDPVRMRQVLHNLIKNAQEAMPEEGPSLIELRTMLVQEAGTRSVEVRLQDNGPGIPEEELDRIFEPYVTSKAKGTGLGLAIVKKIIEEHGGMIRIDSEYRKGARFIIRLPVTVASPAEETPMDESGLRRNIA